MFSTELGFTLEAAFREASSRHHAFFCLEHLLYAFLFDEQIIETLESCGADMKVLRADLEQFLQNEVERISDVERASGDAQPPLQTPAVQRVLRRAIAQAQASGKKLITAREVLVAMFGEEDSFAIYSLKKQEIDRLDIVNFISHGVSKASAGYAAERTGDSALADEEDEAGEREERGTKRISALEKFCEDLTAKAERNELDPIIGRKAELERAIKVLSRRQKNNPLFLGEPGVGKTAMAHAIAQRVMSGDVPPPMKQARVFSLSVGSLVAGTKFRGDFEDRLKVIVKELSALPAPVLYIDEIHTLVGAGATGSGSLDAANLLKPILSSGKLRCIGSTTYDDYKKNFEKDRALSRRFSTIELPEPSVAETVEILRGLKKHYEDFHDVRYSQGALHAAADLSAKYINERFLPDKAIDVIDEAGAENRIRSGNKRKNLITEQDIERVVGAIAKVPVKRATKNEADRLKELEANLERQVFGQHDAILAVTRSIKRSRANLRSPNKPIGCFLFAGPTGVGKTELARALSQELSVQFHRFDMSEYMEKHSVARLIGAPPGYVGYEEGGILTDLVRKHPHAVLLLDEIEKAHEDIYNILLQVMDNASLTDSHGRKTDFRNVVLILTTNAGSEKAAAIGFGMQASTSNRDEAIKKLFKPEFRNRLDEIVNFKALPHEIVEKIVDKFLDEVRDQLKERKVTLEVAPETRALLAKEGFDPVLGARPMARLIQRRIKDPLADEILFGKLSKGGKVSVSGETELSFDFAPN